MCFLVGAKNIGQVLLKTSYAGELFIKISLNWSSYIYIVFSISFAKNQKRVTVIKELFK